MPSYSFTTTGSMSDESSDTEQEGFAFTKTPGKMSKVTARGKGKVFDSVEMSPHYVHILASPMTGKNDITSDKQGRSVNSSRRHVKVVSRESFFPTQSPTGKVSTKQLVAATPPDLKEQSFSDIMPRPGLTEFNEEHPDSRDALEDITVAASNKDDKLIKHLSANCSALLARSSEDVKGESKVNDNQGKVETTHPAEKCDKPTKQHDLVTPDLTMLSEEFSELNVKGIPASEGASNNPEGPSSSSKDCATQTDDDEVFLLKVQMLDRSYQLSGVLSTGNAGSNDAHRKRVMLILDNSRRTDEIISMCLRNNKDIDLMELLRQFDYFSK